jgi:hypothetical protein
MMTLHSVKKMSVKIADASLMNVSATNLIGCGEMSSTYTFTLTIQDEVDGSEPMTEQGAMDYIIYQLEKQAVIQVLNIVRDY